MKSTLKDAKIYLYKLLLELEPDELTRNEIEIGHLLAKDRDIQEVLSRKLGKEEPTL